MISGNRWGKAINLLLPKGAETTTIVGLHNPAPLFETTVDVLQLIVTILAQGSGGITRLMPVNRCNQ